MNKGYNSIKLGLNEWSYLNFEEFADKFLMKDTEKFRTKDYLKQRLEENPGKCFFRKSQNANTSPKVSPFDYKRRLQSQDPIAYAQSIGIPTKIDWSHLLTPVKNQRRCNSCYAFAGVGVLEAWYKKKTGKTEILSEQEIIDCSYWDSGCSGGDPLNSFLYQSYSGLARQSSYAYTAVAATCKTIPRSQKVYQTNYPTYINGDVASLLQALQNGPVAVLHEVDKEFTLYKTGVIEKEYCGTNLNHSAVCFGYDLVNGVPHIILKNGWGSTWGDLGKYRLALGSFYGYSRGACGCLSHDYNSQPDYA